MCAPGSLGLKHNSPSGCAPGYYSQSLGKVELVSLERSWSLKAKEQKFLKQNKRTNFLQIQIALLS